MGKCFFRLCYSNYENVFISFFPPHVTILYFIFTSWGLRMFFIIKLSEDIEIHLMYINDMNWIAVRFCYVKWNSPSISLEVDQNSTPFDAEEQWLHSRSRSMLLDSVLSSTEPAAMKLQRRRSKLWRSQWGPQSWKPAADGWVLWRWSCGDSRKWR